MYVKDGNYIIIFRSTVINELGGAGATTVEKYDKFRIEHPKA